MFFETSYASSHYTLHLLVTVLNPYRAKQNIPLCLSHFQLTFSGPKSIQFNDMFGSHLEQFYHQPDKSYITKKQQSTQSIFHLMSRHLY